MRRRTFLAMSLISAVAIAGWSSGDALAKKGDKPPPGKQVTTDDLFNYQGKVPPSEQKAAAKRARQLGLYPGIAGLAVQAPGPGGVAVPARQVP